MHRRQFLRATAATMPLVAGCAGGESDGGEGSTPTDTPTPTSTRSGGGSADATVRINFFQFEPQKAEVTTGGTVRWVNEQGTGHRVVSAAYVDDATEWEFDTGELAQGDAVTRTFEEEGIYHYFCDTHGKQQNCGVVLVGDTSFPAAQMPCNGGSVQ